MNHGQLDDAGEQIDTSILSFDEHFKVLIKSSKRSLAIVMRLTVNLVNIDPLESGAIH